MHKFDYKKLNNMIYERILLSEVRTGIDSNEKPSAHFQDMDSVIKTFSNEDIDFFNKKFDEKLKKFLLNENNSYISEEVEEAKRDEINPEEEEMKNNIGAMIGSLMNLAKSDDNSFKNLSFGDLPSNSSSLLGEYIKELKAAYDKIDISKK